MKKSKVLATGWVYEMELNPIKFARPAWVYQEKPQIADGYIKVHIVRADDPRRKKT